MGSTISYERLWWANKQQTLLVSSSFSAAVGTHLSVGRKVYAEIGVIYPLLSSSLAPELGIRYQGSGKSPFIKLYGWRLWHLGKNSEESPRILGGLAVGYAF